MANLNLVSRVLQSITSTSLQSIRKFYSEMFPGYTLEKVYVFANYGKGKDKFLLDDAKIDIIRQKLNHSNRNSTVGLLFAYMVRKLIKNKGNPNELKPVIKFFYRSKRGYVVRKEESSNSWMLPELDLATSDKRLLKSPDASSKLQRSNSLVKLDEV